MKPHQITLACETCKVGDLHGFAFNRTACFVWFSERLSWLKAKLRCRKHGGTLARLHAKEVNRFVFNAWFFADLLRRDFYELERDYPVVRGAPSFGHGESQNENYHYHKNELWFGGIRSHPEARAKWIWLLGYPFNFTRWGSGYSRIEWVCLSARPGYVVRPPVMDNFDLFWYASDCLVSLPFICEYPTVQSKMVMDKNIDGTTGTSSAWSITIWVLPSSLSILSQMF